MSIILLSLLASAYLPNLALTPGDVNPVLTDAVLMAQGFRTGPYRHVPLGEKKAVFKLYGIPWAEHLQYEVDHLFSLEIGGSNDIKNLWPEPLHLNVMGLDEGARVKDGLEDHLASLVKHGKITGEQARAYMVPDWTVSYSKLIGPLPVFKEQKTSIVHGFPHK